MTWSYKRVDRLKACVCRGQDTRGQTRSAGNALPAAGAIVVSGLTGPLMARLSLLMSSVIGPGS